MSLADYRTLGRSGLAVSPLALGTMTFGTARWGMDEAGSKEVFDAYVDGGGNFIDTADVYSSGRSEKMLGGFVADRRLRERLVLATKAGFAAGEGPHAGGAGAKHLAAALDGSLRRLRTVFIDLYWLHVWDGVTPAAELLDTMTGFVRSGKIRYWGLSNVPAWFAAKIATLAAVRGLPGPIALQYFYSLVNRDVEDEHVPLAADSGMGLVPWSPLAYGLLTGKYDRAKVEASRPARRWPAARCRRGRGRAGRRRQAARWRQPVRRHAVHRTQLGHRRHTLIRVAEEAGQSPARVALAWVVGRPQVAATLMGVSRKAQVADNVAALDLMLSPEHRAALDAASAPAEPRLLYGLSRPPMRDQVVFGGSSVRVM